MLIVLFQSWGIYFHVNIIQKRIQRAYVHFTVQFSFFTYAVLITRSQENFKFWGIYLIALNYFISNIIAIVENYREHRFHHSSYLVTDLKKWYKFLLVPITTNLLKHIFWFGLYIFIFGIFTVFEQNKSIYSKKRKRLVD